jgi:hypothetical protein
LTQQVKKTLSYDSFSIGFQKPNFEQILPKDTQAG